MKFKVGYIVTVVKCLHTRDVSDDNRYVQIGESATVKSVSDKVYWLHEKSCGRYEQELELAEICKSPLWKVLQ